MAAKKTIMLLSIIGLLCCILSIVAVFMAYKESGDKSHLYKISLPGILLVIIISRMRKMKSNGAS